jgi:cAMP phosphodiesterase
MTELGSLARLASPANPSLAGVTLVVTHIKPALDGSDPTSTIAAQVNARNSIGLKVVIPRQGETLWF